MTEDISRQPSGAGESARRAAHRLLAEWGGGFSGFEVLASLEKVEAPKQTDDRLSASILLADAAGQVPTHYFCFQ
jgi:hypothetical protein